MARVFRAQIFGMITPPLSEKRGSAASGFGCLVLFFLVFLLAGGFVFHLTVLKPALGMVAARSWAQAPCRIVSSQVGESQDSDGGSTYRVEITYTYRYQGRAYQSDRYDFSTGSSSGYEGKAEVVARYPPDSECVCWVDPADPTRAVLDRELHFGYFPLALIAFVFMGAGAGGIGWTLSSARRQRAARLAPAAAGPLAGGERGSLELRPRVSPGMALLGGVLISLFWNGIVSVLVWRVVESWRAGEPEGCLTAFAVPFVLVGLNILYYTGRKFLELFNPRPRLTLSPASPAVGETAYLAWSFSGSSGRVKRLTVVLEGTEEATYRVRSGKGRKSSRTDREVFATIPVVEVDHPFTLAAGSVSFSLPPGTMHSFTAQHNKIVWTLKIHSEIPGWPDSNDEYGIQVRPGA